MDGPSSSKNNSSSETAQALNEQQRLRIRPSCTTCSKKKVKCNKKSPCSYCLDRGLACNLPSTNLVKPRKRRFAEGELLLRLKRYEALLRSHGVNPEDGMPPHHGEEGSRSSTRFVQQSTPDTYVTHSGVDKVDANQDFEKLASIIGPSLDAQAGLQSSQVSKMASDSPNMHSVLNHLDKVYQDDGHELFQFQDLFASQAIPTPSASQIFKLWQCYVERIHPVVKLVHIPTIQNLIFQSAAGATELKPSEMALLHSVYFAALSSMTEGEVLESFFGSSPSSNIIFTFLTNCRTAFCRANVWRSADITSVQSLLIYSLPLSLYTDPRSLASFYGMLDRLARRIGLHRNGSASGIVEQAMRRRIWWELHAFDCRASEKSIGGAGAMGGGIDCPLPQLVDEIEVTTDLSMSVEPGTECLIAGVRWNIAKFHSQVREACHGNVGHFELMSPALSRAAKLAKIDLFEAHLQETIIKHCNDRNPMHQLARHLARGEIAKSRMFVLTDSSVTHDNSLILQQALIQLQCENKWHSIAVERNLLLFINLHFPLIAYLYTLYILSSLNTGVDAESAWQIVLANPWAFKSLQKYDSSICGQQRTPAAKPMLGALLLKAWKARATFLGLSRAQEPCLITETRALWESGSPMASPNALAQPNDDVTEDGFQLPDYLAEDIFQQFNFTWPFT